MDTLYIGDIPLSYHYISFESNGDIILRDREVYDTPGYYPTYTIISNSQNKFIYTKSNLRVSEGQVFNYPGLDVPVSNKWYDRPDCLNIMFLTLCVTIITFFIVNLFTSIFKKGGLLGGLF